MGGTAAPAVAPRQSRRPRVARPLPRRRAKRSWRCTTSHAACHRPFNSPQALPHEWAAEGPERLVRIQLPSPSTGCRAAKRPPDQVASGGIRCRLPAKLQPLLEGLWIFRIANPLRFLPGREVVRAEESPVVYSRVQGGSVEIGGPVQSTGRVRCSGDPAAVHRRHLSFRVRRWRGGAVRFGYAKADRRVTAYRDSASAGGRGAAVLGAGRRFSTGRDRPRGPDRSRGAGQAREAATELLGLAKRASLTQKWWVTSRG